MGRNLLFLDYRSDAGGEEVQQIAEILDEVVTGRAHGFRPALLGVVNENHAAEAGGTGALHVPVGVIADVSAASLRGAAAAAGQVIDGGVGLPQPHLGGENGSGEAVGDTLLDHPVGDLRLRDRNGGSGEQIDVDLDKVDPNVCEIVFVVSIHDEGMTFGDVKDAFISVVNAENDEELCRYELNEAFTEETALSVAKLVVNEDGDWEFEAVGVGHVGGLETLIDIYAS